MKHYISLLALALLFAACSSPQKQSGVDLSMMDTSVRPQDDFYRYMNGKWLASFEIPPDRSNFGMFTRLADKAETDLRTIIEEAAAQKAPAGSDPQKVGDLYAAFMDTVRADQLRLAPIVSDLDRIRAAGSRDDLVRVIAQSTLEGTSTPFIVFISQDAKRPTTYAIHFYQAGISMPDRDYYLREEPKFAEFRAKLLAHIEKMFGMAGIAEPAVSAKRVVAIETALAKAHWTNVENRDRVKTYNKLAVGELGGAFNWSLFASASEWKTADSVIVYQPSYIKAFSELFGSLPLDDWKAYVTWHMLTSWAPYLSSEFVSEDFGFFETTLKGVPENRPRWKRGVGLVEAHLGEIVGKLYVERHFPPEAKQRMLELVGNLKSAFHERINGLKWMGAETKAKALQKLDKFNAKIGYPDKWKDYAAVSVKADDLVGSIRSAARATYAREMNKIGKPIDRTEWLMTPQTVNAYYNPDMNEVVFPAAILQPPFFNLAADDAVNYGAIGAVIGHEMTHGFDDQGRMSDGDGNLTDWWTETDSREFTKRAELVAAQYGAYTPIDTMKVNGHLTLGENISDLGGLTIAYYAYKKSLGGSTPEVIDGFSGEQRFFLGWAQVWARKYRDDEMRRRLLTDPHSPSEYRANGVVANMPEFYASFGVKEGDRLWRGEAERAMIW